MVVVDDSLSLGLPLGNNGGRVVVLAIVVGRVVPTPGEAGEGEGEGEGEPSLGRPEGGSMLAGAPSAVGPYGRLVPLEVDPAIPPTSWRRYGFIFRFAIGMGLVLLLLVFIMILLLLLLLPLRWLVIGAMPPHDKEGEDASGAPIFPLYV